MSRPACREGSGPDRHPGGVGRARRGRESATRRAGRPP